MDQFELFQRLAVALGIGLLIGIERGWLVRDDAEGERAVGVRTLALAGLLGGVFGAIALVHPQAGGPLLAGAFVVYAFSMGFFRYREMLRDGTLGTTTIVAALLAFALGALAVLVDKTLAAAAGVTAAALLSFKGTLHDWLRRMTWPELRAGLMLLAMSVILLPVLPNRDLGPLGTFNPYELWLMTILIAAVSAVGYFAIKFAGANWGILVSAVAGGLVSSTAVTLTFAGLMVEHREREPLLRAGILASNTTMMMRVLVLVAIFKADLLRWMALPLLLAIAVLLAWAMILHFRSNSMDDGQALELGSPFELSVVLKFGALLTVIMLLAKVITVMVGAAGAMAVAAASGIADVDAITLSMLRLAGRELAAPVAAGAVLVAVGVNSLMKAALAASVAGVPAGRRVGVAMLVAVAVGTIAYILSVALDPLARVLPPTA